MGEKEYIQGGLFETGSGSDGENQNDQKYETNLPAKQTPENEEKSKAPCENEDPMFEEYLKSHPPRINPLRARALDEAEKMLRLNRVEEPTPEKIIKIATDLWLAKFPPETRRPFERENVEHRFKEDYTTINGHRMEMWKKYTEEKNAPIRTIAREPKPKDEYTGWLNEWEKTHEN